MKEAYRTVKVIVPPVPVTLPEEIPGTGEIPGTDGKIASEFRDEITTTHNRLSVGD